VAIRGFAPLADVDTTAPALALDESQRAVLQLANAASAAIIGAPGTGKTTAMIELVAERVLGRGWAPDELVVLTPSRASATSLRDRLATRLGVPTLGPLARTVNSLAFDIVRDAAAQQAEEPPRLLTGAEQDQIIADLLEGEIDDPELGEYWPDQLDSDIRRLRGFRTELRDLMMRAVEHGILPADLARLGQSTGRPEWTAAARFIDLYDDVKASFRERHFDSTELVQEAAAIVRDSPSDLLGRLRLVILDDAQESTESTMMLVRALAARGVAVIAVGDPDISTGAFRGALPEVLGRLAQQLEVPAVEEFHLSTVHRHGAGIRGLTTAITNRIGTAGAGRQRRAVAPEAPANPAAAPSAVSYAVTSRADEIALIARRLRERHVLGGVPWGEMAVIVRTGVSSLSQSLQALEVQTTVASARAALRDEYAVRGLVLLLELGLGREPLTAASAVELLLGPVGGLDAVTLRRLKHALRHEELAGEGDRSGDELVAEALAHPGALATIDTRVARRATRVAANLAAVREEADAGATIEELLWGVWQRSGLEKLWFEQSMGAGLVAEEANRHLDAVVALFSSAKRFVERTPDAAPAQFLDAWVSADVPEDTLAPRSVVDAVTVGTPASVIGREFEVVVIAGLQENVWPNLRIRGSLLGSQDLAAAWAGTLAEGADKRLEVMHDELRLFAQAVSRARSEVVVTAVANDDSLPSAFLRLVPQGDPAGLQRHPLSLRGMVGQLRRELTGTGSGAAAAGLARLADENVPGAHPSAWYGLAEPSTLAPLVDLTEDDAHVRVSPSRMESFETCALHWMIDQVGGGSSSTASNLGTIIHSVAEESSDHSPDALYAAVEKRWGELYFESEWHSRVERTRARELTDRLSAYLDEFDRVGGQLLATEKNFELDLGHARLSGSIDRVESYPDGTAVIVDLKTGKRDPSTDDGVVDHPQLGAYQLAFASGAIEGLPEGVLPGGAKLVIVSKGSRGKAYTEPRQAAFTAEQLEAFRERVVADAVGMADRVFVAQIGTHCLDPWSFGRCTIHVVKAVSS